MTASWPAFIGGAAFVFIAFNAVFAFFYWLGDHPITDVPAGRYIEAVNAGLVVSGYDDVAAQTVHARKSYEYTEMLFGHRYAEILRMMDDGCLRIDCSRFHETIEG